MTVTREMVLAVANWCERMGYEMRADGLRSHAARVWPVKPEPPSYSHWGMFPE